MKVQHHKPWCCPPFRERACEADDGFQILPTKTQNRIEFFICFTNKQVAISANFENNDHIVTTTKQFIKFCPWCGVRLSRYYKIADKFFTNILDIEIYFPELD
jgi:hypothetical protein